MVLATMTDDDDKTKKWIALFELASPSSKKVVGKADQGLSETLC